MTTTQKITAKKFARIAASLRDQRADVHAGIKTLAEYHANVDRTVAYLAENGAPTLPEDVVKWGR